MNIKTNLLKTAMCLFIIGITLFAYSCDTTTTIQSTTTTTLPATTTTLGPLVVTDLTLDNEINTGDSFVIINSGDYFYYTGWNDIAGNLGVINFSDPQNPTIAGTYVGGVGGGCGIATDGRYVYVETDGGGADNFPGSVLAFDCLDPTNITLIDQTEDGYSSAYQNYFYNGYLYNVSSTIVSIFDMSDPAYLDYQTEISCNNAHWAAFQGEYMYLPETSSLSIYDISNPADPTTDGSYTMYSGTLAVSANYAFVGGSSSLITSLNITDHASISEADTLTLSGPSSTINSEMKVRGNYLFIVSKVSFWVVDISDPTNMSEIAVFDGLDNNGCGFDFYGNDYILVCDDLSVKVLKIIH